MHVAPRSYLTAGIAVLGAGAIAVAPVQPVPTQVAFDSHRVVSGLGVDLLASSIDPITPWVNAFETAGTNIATLVEFYMQKPFPILQTIGANWATYIEQLSNGQGNLIPEQIWGNIQTFFEAPWDPGQLITVPQADIGTEFTGPFPACDTPSSCSSTAQPAGYSSQDLWYLFWNIVGGISAEDPLTNEGALPALTIWNTIIEYEQVLDFVFTPYSGQVLGWLGPLLSPVIQLTRSFSAVGEFFEDGDITAVINELINIPANMTNAFLNGAGFWDLTPILEEFLGGPLPAVPPYLTPDLKIGLNLGGLLNAVPRNGSLANPDNPPSEWFGIGFDALSLRDTPDAFFGDKNNIIYGYPNGLGGASIALGQFLGEQLLVTPPAPPTQAAAEPEAAKLAAPADIEVPAEVVDDAAPAVVEVAAPVTESAPAVVEDVAEEPAPVVVAEVEEAAPAEIDVAEIEAAVAEVEAEVAEAEAPAVAEDNAPATATGSDDSGDTGTRATDSRRGAASDD